MYPQTNERYTIHVYVYRIIYMIYLYRNTWIDFHNYLSMLAVYTVDTVQKSTLQHDKQIAFKLDSESMWSMFS